MVFTSVGVDSKLNKTKQKKTKVAYEVEGEAINQFESVKGKIGWMFQLFESIWRKLGCFYWRVL